ncbi:hypothetical protein YC2023_094241 [Brassica napus]
MTLTFLVKGRGQDLIRTSRWMWKTDNGVVNGLEYPSDELFRNFLDGQASGSGADQTDPPGFNDFALDLNSFFNFGMPSNGLHLVTEALKASCTEARTALFKAEVAEI